MAHVRVSHPRAEVVVFLAPAPVRVRIPVHVEEVTPGEEPRAAPERRVAVFGVRAGRAQVYWLVVCVGVEGVRDTWVDR